MRSETMHRLIFLVSLSAFVGCGTATKPQEFGTPIDDSPSIPTLKIAGEKPETTEAATRELFDKIVLAHTNNQPSRIEQLRKHKQHRKGERIVGDFRSPLEMDVVASWPMRYRANYLHTMPDKIVHAFSFRNDTGWQNRSDIGAGQRIPILPLELDSMLPDVRAEWVASLVPLIADNIRIARVPSEKLNSEMILRFWYADQPPVILHADSKTNWISQIAFEAKDDGQTVTRMLTLSDHRPVNGVVLPHRIEFSGGPRFKCNWATVEYEFPVAIDEAIFDKP